MCTPFWYTRPSMIKSTRGLLSFVIPVFNEEDGLGDFHAALVDVAEKVMGGVYEIIYCDDGSVDGTAQLVRKFRKQNSKVRLVALSRNFGKENALAAGIATAKGEAIILLDGDGQHPVKVIPEFIEAWQRGAQVVIGVRQDNQGASWFKRLGSRWFYRIFNRLSHEHIIPGSTDFRLIDRAVQTAFLELRETDRLTRGLIDWLGFKRQIIRFDSQKRQAGRPAYNQRQLIKLAVNSFVSLTTVPLYLFGYLGLFITTGSLLLGGSVLIEQILFRDPWHWNFTGTAMLSTLLLFLVGVLLLSQGMLSLYVSHIHAQTKQRPLYVIDYSSSEGIDAEKDNG
jgi:glycosyltransferase involved in cell wall biosynthesis